MTGQSKRSFASLISTEQLKSNLERVKVLDGSWHMPNTNRNPYQEFIEKRIITSRFFDIDGIKESSTDLPHMLPSPKVFADAVGKMGIDENDHVVVYDSVGIFSACRVYWTFKAFGHQSVSVLSGGLPAWEKEHGPVESGVPERIKEKEYKLPQLNQSLVRDYPTILDNARKAQNGSHAFQVLDARPYARFTGEAAEPRVGLSSGHMPGSISVAFNEVIGPDGQFYDDQKLCQLFQEKGVDLSKEIVTSCGSGITASILYMALERAGAKNLAVYDGSWTEYASQKDAIIIKQHK
ncbi:hypothetical protein G6F61_001653 [Rhizopus arrhizus]|uniref:Rhodanese domain-containing protein n=1 Tax=Rhizopus oryzae TaxID=64495 RepID=A0A9P6XFX8_RHIOR|nr:hypothetical protein G6F64_002603 [Rhizopus arrhizus]KAG1383122.1 hypothetical protein G6F61_001653 [Rhizopus arrhizus]